MTAELTWLRDFAIQYTAAWCSQDPASVARLYAREGWLCVNDGTPAIGREAIAEVVQSFMVAFPDLQVLLDNVVARGDRMEYHWTLVGTNTGPGGEGRRVRLSGYEDWLIGEDGLIAESKGHFDAAAYQRQLAHKL